MTCQIPHTTNFRHSVTSHRVVSCHVVSRRVASRRVVSCHVVSAMPGLCSLPLSLSLSLSGSSESRTWGRDTPPPSPREPRPRIQQARLARPSRATSAGSRGAITGRSWNYRAEPASPVRAARPPARSASRPAGRAGQPAWRSDRGLLRHGRPIAARASSAEAAIARGGTGTRLGEGAEAVAPSDMVILNITGIVFATRVISSWTWRESLVSYRHLTLAPGLAPFERLRAASRGRSPRGATPAARGNRRQRDDPRENGAGEARGVGAEQGRGPTQGDTGLGAAVPETLRP